MSFLRALTIWLLALSLPVDAFAAASMASCKGMQRSVPAQMSHDMSGHDHAAMMTMAAGDTADMHQHHSMGSEKSASKTSAPGCQCGCKCSGDCAVSCAAALVAFTVNRTADEPIVPPTLALVALRGQAHEAYRFDPIRPPAAVAL